MIIMAVQWKARCLQCLLEAPVLRNRGKNEGNTQWCQQAGCPWGDHLGLCMHIPQQGACSFVPNMYKKKKRYQSDWENLFHFKLYYGANLGSPWPSPRGCGDFSWKLRFQCVTSSSVTKQKSPWSTLLLLHLVQPGSGVSNVFQFIRIYFRPTNLYSVLFPEMWWGSNYYVKGESVAVWNCVSLESCLPFQF